MYMYTVQCKETRHWYKLSSDEKDTIAIRAGKAKVVEKLNSFLSIWVIRIRVTHLLVQFKLYKRSQFTVHSEIFLDASYTYEHCLLQLFGRPKKVYKQNTVKLVVDFQKLA